MFQTPPLDNPRNSLRRKTSLRDSIRIFRTSSKDSIKSNQSFKKGSASDSIFTVHEQNMHQALPILRDAEATSKLLEAIYESPSGRRSISRLARTCRALSDPALAILWRDLDSILPIVGLFPGQLMKKSKKPALGLSRMPRDEDWKAIAKYAPRVRRITYDENSSITPSIFSVLQDCRPRSMPYILPYLQELTWKVETPAALERSMIFMSPGLQIINLEVGAKFPQMSTFLTDMSSRTNLKGFSYITPTSLPDAFPDLIARHEGLEKVVLVAPGALGSNVGRWVAGLRHLKHLQLDLTGRAPIAVEGFFDELSSHSGMSTPSSVASRDSGIFSGEELDFTENRKSALRLPGESQSKAQFPRLRRVHLTGEAANITVFLKHIESDLTHLDLVIEDPPDNADWTDLSSLMCERFGETLQSIRISATASSRYADLVRQTSRGEAAKGRLSLEQFNNLPNLNRFEVDLPESVLFTPRDINCIAQAAPRLEVLRLSPQARFPSPHAPKITFEDLTPLITNCRRLHTLAVVVNALPGSSETLQSALVCSPSLLRLHVGHSWIADPLQVAILLSHMTPRMEALKWFQEKTRAGFNEIHSKNWQTVSEILPHLQLVRSVEKSFIRATVPLPPKRRTAEVGIDATPSTRSRGVSAQVQTSTMCIQASPATIDCGIDARPRTCDMGISALPLTRDMAIETESPTVSSGVQTIDFEELDTQPPMHTSPILRSIQNIYVISSLFNLLTFAYRFAVFPLSLSQHLFRTALVRYPTQKPNGAIPLERRKPASVSDVGVGSPTIETMYLSDSTSSLRY